MLWWTFVVWLGQVVAAERPQIGHYPINGNVWRAKDISEIRQPLSVAFRNFSQNCTTLKSNATNIIYYVSEPENTYQHIETDNSICVYSVERNMPNARNYYSQDVLQDVHFELFDTSIVNYTFYFACDEYCCGLECCQRDVGMTIVGFTLISVSAIIILFYGAVYCGGMLCAWRNGALGKKLQFNGKSPEKKKKKLEETSMSVLRPSESMDTNGGPS
ncbi:unnamed protein product, partial [Mesorhabditis spiculigera]